MITKPLTNCVVVVGGGPAGVAAAVCAARSGARTLLLEQRACLGGTITAGFQNQLCGVYANDPSHPFHLLNPGIAEEIIRALDACCCDDPRQQVGKVEVHGFEPLRLAQVLKKITGSEPALTVLAGVGFSSLVMEQGKIVRLSARKSGESQDRIKIKAPMTIVDCCGGQVVAAAGAGQKKDSAYRRPLAGFSLVIEGLVDQEDNLAVRVPYAIRQAVMAGKLPADARVTTFSPAPAPGKGILRLNIPPSNRSPNQLGQAVHTWLKTRLQAFEHSRISQTSPELLPRDGYCLEGESVLTEADVVNARKCQGRAVKCAWPVEFWEENRGPVFTYIEEGAYYDIPAGCLRSRNIENLFAAGRSLSAEPNALASCRVGGTCFSLGEAAAEEAVRKLHEYC